MRPVAFLCLLFGFIGMLLLDGQTFTHAVAGSIFGVVAVVCGMVSARRDPPHRWEGWIMAGFGVCLSVWCIIQFPSAFATQKRFNDRKEQRLHQKQEPANKPLEPTAAGSSVIGSRSARSRPWSFLGGCGSAIRCCKAQ